MGQVITDEVFQQAVNDALGRAVKPADLIVDLIREFSASKGTIDRWSQGESCPHPTVRPAIVEYLNNYPAVEA